MQGGTRRGRLIAQRTELLEDELHTDPYKLHQLGVGALVRFYALPVIDPDPGDFREVAHDLANLSRKSVGVLDGAAAETVKETLTPLPEGHCSRIERGLIFRQQQLELHFGSFERSRGLPE